MNPILEQEALWIQNAKQNPEEFHHLFDKYYSQIMNYILRRTCDPALSKDITANTFLKALQNLSKYEWKGVPFSSWLYRIAINEIKLHYRKNGRFFALTEERAHHLRSDLTTDQDMLHAEETLQKNAQYKRMNKALSKLKEKYQTVLTLRYYEELPIKDIADILEINENTIKTHIYRGLQQLKKAYELLK